jgi:hypothetical protein
MAVVGIRNKASVIAMIRNASAAAAQAASAKTKEEVDAFAAAVQEVAPAGETGVLKTTVRVEPGSKPGFWAVVVGAVPATRKRVRARVKEADYQAARQTGGYEGEYDYPLGVEFGHKTPEGEHVAAHPFLFPTYRGRKAGMRSRIRRAVLAAYQKFNLGGS